MFSPSGRKRLAADTFSPLPAHQAANSSKYSSESAASSHSGTSAKS